MKKINLHIIVLFAMIVLPLLSMAQDPDGFGDFGGDALPVDGGLSLLVAGGIGYGIKKIKERKLREKN